MNEPLHVLIVVTSHAALGDTGRPTGLWAEEFAVPYYVLQDAGAQITIASPQGGATPIDPGSQESAGDDGLLVRRLFDDARAQAALAATKPVAQLDGASFDAVFFPGGHGTMWDLPDDPGIRRVVEAAWAAGRIVAAVCHGPAGLVSARAPDGRSILAGMRVSAFTNAEEDAVGLADVVPFQLETRLRELGARFESAPAWQPFAVVDGRLVTGQNPQSSRRVAELMLGALTHRNTAAA